MNLLRLLPRLAAASFAFALSAQASAYCLTHTCDPKKETCEVVGGCNVSGNVLFWPNAVVSFNIQQDGSKRQDITSDQLRTVVKNGFQRWVDATCSDGRGPKIELQDYGDVSCAKPEYNKDQPNQNVITFHDGTWPYANTGAETLALTTVFFNGETGEIYDANIEINSNQANFALGASQATGDRDDLNAVLTHELGHFLGLSHSNVGDATMYQSYQIGMTSLEQDDMDAICASLPPDRVPLTNSSTPRHGFSTECGKPENGCCSSTIGGKAPPSGTLALWAFGLGVVVWGGRAASKRRRP